MKKVIKIIGKQKLIIVIILLIISLELTNVIYAKYKINEDVGNLSLSSPSYKQLEIELYKADVPVDSIETLDEPYTLKITNHNDYYVTFILQDRYYITNHDNYYLSCDNASSEETIPSNESVELSCSFTKDDDAIEDLEDETLNIEIAVISPYVDTIEKEISVKIEGTFKFIIDENLISDGFDYDASRGISSGKVEIELPIQTNRNGTVISIESDSNFIILNDSEIPFDSNDREISFVLQYQDYDVNTGIAGIDSSTYDGIYYYLELPITLTVQSEGGDEIDVKTNVRINFADITSDNFSISENALVEGIVCSNINFSSDYYEFDDVEIEPVETSDDYFNMTLEKGVYSWDMYLEPTDLFIEDLKNDLLYSSGDLAVTLYIKVKTPFSSVDLEIGQIYLSHSDLMELYVHYV